MKFKRITMQKGRKKFDPEMRMIIIPRKVADENRVMIEYRPRNFRGPESGKITVTETKPKILRRPKA